MPKTDKAILDPNSPEIPVVESSEAEVDSTVKSGMPLIESTDGAESPAETPAVTPDIEERLKKYEQDINRLKSTYQKKESDITKEKSALEKKLEEVLKANMSDDDKRLYEQERLKEKLSASETRLAELEQQTAQFQQFNTWQKYFVGKFGIPISELDFDNGLEGLFTSGMQAVEKRAIAPTSEQKAKAVVTDKPKAKTPPETASPAGGKVPAYSTIQELADKFSGGDVENLFRMADRGRQDVINLLNEVASSNK